MRKYFEIDGYWKEDKSEFEGYIVTNYDDHEEDTSLTEDDIFYYGMEVLDLDSAIEEGENTVEDFVITSYEELIFN